MQAKKCDRCGEFYEIYNNINNPRKCNGVQLLNILESYDTKIGQRAFELCPKCMEGLMRWLYAVKNRKEG